VTTKEETGVNTKLRLATAAVILAFGMILSSAVLSKFFVRIKHEQAITVKGYAERDVLSDVGKFKCTCSARGTTLKESYGKLQESRAAVLDYLKRRGFTEPETASDTIHSAKVNRRDAQGKELNDIEFYDVFQTITVGSTNVTLIGDAATSITELIKDGIDIRAAPPEFYVSDLKDTKLELLAKATADGYHRAMALAQNSRGKVGALTSAEQGVFQITKKNSTDTSGYGVYDTSTIEKTVKVVVTLEYAIATKD
jgi:uncharacterized protein